MVSAWRCFDRNATVCLPASDSQRQQSSDMPITEEQLHPHRRDCLRTARVALLLTLCCATSSARAQQSDTRTESTSVRADYRDIAELLEKLPRATPPVFDEARALWLGALPLGCIDRLQSRPGGRPATRPATAPEGGRGGDSTNNSTGARGGTPAANSGAGYFWVPTYTVMLDHDRLRAFWGCNDWHSSVGSTWATVRLLRHFPKGALDVLAREKLNAHLGRANLDGEFDFFRATAGAINPIPSASQSGLFERPYGFAWFLTLHAELRAWPDTQATRWAANTAPLARWMANSLTEYFAKLVEPIRSGGQANTAQSLTLAFDYANAVGDPRLRQVVVSTARRLFAQDTVCTTQSERPIAVAVAGGRGGGRRGTPDGNADSLARLAQRPNDLTAAARLAPPTPEPGGGGPVVVSPCLSEAALMSSMLEPRAYLTWLDRFLPPLPSGRFAPLTEPLPAPATVRATDSTATAATSAAFGIERARLAGLSFARAQSMERIARALPPRDPRVAVWHRLSDIQAERGFELMRDDTAGLFWLPAQALLYEAVRKR